MDLSFGLDCATSATDPQEVSAQRSPTEAKTPFRSTDFQERNLKFIAGRMLFIARNQIESSRLKDNLDAISFVWGTVRDSTFTLFVQALGFDPVDVRDGLFRLMLRLHPELIDLIKPCSPAERCQLLQKATTHSETQSAQLELFT